MSDRTPRLERFLERALDVGGSRTHPAEVLQRVHKAAEESVRDGAVANAYIVQFDEGTASAFLPHKQVLLRALERMLDDLVRSQGLRRHAAWQMELTTGPGANSGVAVTALFRNAHAGQQPATGATRAIRRRQGCHLHVAGGERVALTHTPFTIGRGRECDLTVLDFAISRIHAVIEEGQSAELILRDLGSRNLIVVGGEDVHQVVLEPGTAFTLGDTTITFEGPP